MKVLEESATNDGVGVDADAELLEHGVDVGALLLLAALAHRHENATALVDVAPNVLELLGVEGEAGCAEEQEVGLLHLLERQVGLVDLALYDKRVRHHHIYEKEACDNARI